MNYLKMSDDFEELQLGELQADITYTFKNIQLLRDAITHSKATLFGNPVKSKSFKNLAAVGSAVLKVITAEESIRENYRSEERSITKHNEYIKENYLSQMNNVARRLFGTVDKRYLYGSVVQISEGILHDPNFGEVPYHKFLKSVLGAVFLDSGGIAGNGIKKCRGVIEALWGVDEDLPDLQSCFPVPEIIREYWTRMGIDEAHLRALQIRFDLKSRNPDFLCEAFIHESFYNPLKGQEDVADIHKPDYQRLAFLGEMVIELIIAEFMFEKYSKVKKSIVEFVDSQIDPERRKQVAEKIGLNYYVKRGSIAEFEEYEMISLMALIGAAYVDCGVDDTKDFVLSKWKLTEPDVWKPDCSTAAFSPWKDERIFCLKTVSWVLVLTCVAISFLKHKP